MEYSSAIKDKNIMNFAGKWIKLDTYHPELSKPDTRGHACVYSQRNNNRKVQEIQLHSIHPDKLNKKEGPNEHGWILRRRGNEKVIGGKLKRGN